LIDPIFREGKTTTDKIKTGIPLLSKTVAPYKDPLGNPSVRQNNTFNSFSPIQVNPTNEQFENVYQKTQQDKKAKAIVDSLKSQVESGQLPNGVSQLPNGKIAIVEDNAVKEFKNESVFNVYKFEKEFGANDENKAQYSLDYQRARRNDDINKYMEVSQARYDYLENYKKLLDTKEDAKKLISIDNEQDDLLYYMQKYASYGGFTKPKSGGGRSGRSPSVTRAITMAKATPGVSKIKATTGSYNSAKSRGKIKVAVAPPSVKIPISKKYTGKQLAQMR